MEVEGILGRFVGYVERSATKAGKREYPGAERKSSWLQQASRRIFARSSPHGSRGQTWACSLGLKSSLFGT